MGDSKLEGNIEKATQNLNIYKVFREKLIFLNKTLKIANNKWEMLKNIYWQKYCFDDKIYNLIDIQRFTVYNKREKEGVKMEKNRTVSSIKKTLESHLGEKVMLKANGGRKRVLVNEGVLESVYSSIFVIRLQKDAQRTVTYSYSDVLTNTVQLDFES